MMRRIATTLLALTTAAVAMTAVAHARAPQPSPSDDVLAIIVHRSNPVNVLSFADLRRIFMLETQTWPNGRKITVMLRDKGEPERAEAIRLICGLSEADYERHVLFQTFRGNVGSGPRSIRSTSAMLRFVFNAPGAIGYVGADQLDGSTKVLRIDGYLPEDPGYPVRRRQRSGGGW